MSSERFKRIIVFCIALLVALTGLKYLLAGSSSYRNHWGGLVFAPFAVLLGVVVMVFAVLPDKPSKDQQTKGVRLRPFFKRRRSAPTS